MSPTTIEAVRSACKSKNFNAAKEIITQDREFNPGEIKKKWKLKIIALLQADLSDEQKEEVSQHALNRMLGGFGSCVECGSYKPHYKTVEPAAIWKYPLHRQICRECDDKLSSVMITKGMVI